MILCADPKQGGPGHITLTYHEYEAFDKMGGSVSEPEGRPDDHGAMI